MHGPLNVKLPKTAYGARLVEHWAGVDQSSREKEKKGGGKPSI